MTMKAAVFEGAGKPLAIRQVSIPQPGPGQLLIRVKRCGICGSDLHMTDAKSCFNPAPGAVIGHEFAGEVVQLGEDTSDQWHEGDRLAALPYIGCGKCRACLSGNPTRCAHVLSQPSGGAIGGYAEYCLVNGYDSVRLHPELSWEQGAFVEPLAVGIHTIRAAELAFGARVLVVGAGPVGLAVAACAKAAGAATVVVCARTDRRADLALAMGADEFLSSDDELSVRFARVGGGPPEYVFECVGLPGMLQLTTELCAPEGKVIMAGACLQEERFLPIGATMKELTFRFAVTYTRREFAFAESVIADGRIDPMPMFDGLVSLADLPRRFEEMRADKHGCKVMIDLS